MSERPKTDRMMIRGLVMQADVQRRDNVSVYTCTIRDIDTGFEIAGVPNAFTQLSPGEEVDLIVTVIKRRG